VHWYAIQSLAGRGCDSILGIKHGALCASSDLLRSSWVVKFEDGVRKSRGENVSRIDCWFGLDFSW